MTRLDIGPSHLLCILICDLSYLGKRHGLDCREWPKCGHPELGWAICLRKVTVCLSWGKCWKGAVAHLTDLL